MSPGATEAPPDSLTEFATLHAGTAEHLAVLLLGHTLAALLDHRTHIGVTYLSTTGLGPYSPRRALTCAPAPESELESRDGTHPDYLSLPAATKTGRTPPRRGGSVRQPAEKYDVSRYSCTALEWTRNDRPTRTAGSSPEWTSL